MLASSPNQGIPASNPTYPPPSPYTPYPQTNYGESTPPPPPPPYSAPQQGQYGAPLPPYGAPPQQGQYGAQPPLYGAQPNYVPQQPKSNKGCITAIVIVSVVFVLIIGGIVAAGVYAVHSVGNVASTVTSNLQTAVPTIDASLTTTPVTSNGSVPDASQIDTNAATNITSAKTSGAVDSNYLPTDPKTSFSIGNTVYLTFTLAGHPGYATTKIYRDGQFDIEATTPLTVQSGYTNGAFPFTPNHTGHFVAGIYWCTQADCSDAALAQIVAFTVS